MKPWTILLALGVIALAVGGALALLHYHRTVGLGAAGLGVLLLAAGGGTAYLDRKTVKVADQKTAVPAKPQGGLRRALIAIVVVVLIGVGAFYGASYLGSVQPGNSFSSLSSTIATSGQGSGTTTTFSSTTTPILTLFNLVSSNVNVTGGNNVTVTASYINNSTDTLSINFYLQTAFPNGTLWTTGYLRDPISNGTAIQPKAPFNIDINFGDLFFPNGPYIMTFYLIDATSGQHVSSTSNIPFTIANPTT